MYLRGDIKEELGQQSKVSKLLTKSQGKHLFFGSEFKYSLSVKIPRDGSGSSYNKSSPVQSCFHLYQVCGC